MLIMANSPIVTLFCTRTLGLWREGGNNRVAPGATTCPRPDCHQNAVKTSVATTLRWFLASTRSPALISRPDPALGPLRYNKEGARERAR